MDAFEGLISMLLRHEGYWTTPSFKVDLTKEDKQRINRPSSPRWELDLVAYRGSTNDILVVECKSYLDSRGVLFRNGTFKSEARYKLFTDSVLRSVVLARLAEQLQSTQACAPSPNIRLCLAVGKIAGGSDKAELENHFASNGWFLFDPDWIRDGLRNASKRGYENDVAFVVSKILLRGKKSNVITAQLCPICLSKVAPDERYPRYVCENCVLKATSADGRLLAFGNTHLFGGFEARFADSGATYQGHECFINGKRCRVDEAHFGGIVIEAID